LAEHNEEIARSNIEALKYHQKQLNKTTHFMDSIEDALKNFENTATNLAFSHFGPFAVFCLLVFGIFCF